MPKRFAFRLDRLLQLRRMREELKKRELAAANRAVARQQQEILQLFVDEEETKTELRGLKTRTLDLVAIRLREHYLNVLNRRIGEAYRGLQDLQSKVAEKRKELVEAMQGVRVLERLRERKRAEYDLEVSREEQKFLDEVGSRMTREEAS
ncbi:MAG: flagellar export protein FliJ [Planctomycetes bacterium]|nr:flagellar export protein FliJ [Planctomycetota bacterium]